MSLQGWYSKKDVIKDLSKASGKKVYDFDEEYVVVGERPPPPRQIDEDIDIEHIKQFSRENDFDNASKPDLAGITQMLRMVDNFNEGSPSTSPKRETKSRLNANQATKTAANTIVSISKLNPDVPAFVPKSLKSSECTLSNDNKLQTKCKLSESGKCTKEKEHVANSNAPKPEVRVEVVKISSDDIKENNKTEHCDNIVRSSCNITKNRVDISVMTSDELKDMREKLKNKISDTASADCVKIKRERNLAIASLVKLYCQAPNTAENKTPKLVTPDFFEKRLSDNRQRVECSTKSETEQILPKNKETSEAVNKVNQWFNTNQNTVLSSEKNESQKEEDIEKRLSDNRECVENNTKTEPEPILSKNKEISEAVNKVNQWFSTKQSTVSEKNESQKMYGESIKTATEKENCPMSNVSLNEVSENGVNTKEMKQSIEKVDDWLNGSTAKKAKPPTVYLGPVTFKRKVTSKPMSPISNDSEKVTTERHNNVFVPSTYADQLTKKYMERSQVKENGKQNLWTKLEMELKEKDELIKKQRLNQSVSLSDK